MVLRSAHEAAANHAWQEAFEGFSAVDAEHALSPEDLEALSEVAYWGSHVSEAIDARQRAYAAYDAAGRAEEAARAALVASLLHFSRGDTSVASGWLARAQRLLADNAESSAHALLAWVEGQIMGRMKGFEQALDKACEVEAVARRVGDRDLVAMGISMQGYLRVQTGEVAAGMALMDEALTGALAGELGSLATAEIFCEMVVSCIDTADFQRAAEWLDTAERVGRRLVCFPGCCRVHKSTVLRHRGEWAEADRQARQARVEVAGVEVVHEGMALTELGELHRCKGEAALAQLEFREAYEKGWPPQPGMALLHLRTGDVEGAAHVIQHAVEWSADEPSALVRLLPAQVEIAMANGDEEVVEAAAARLAEAAASLGSSTAAAANAFVTGLREQKRGNLSEAARQLQLSVNTWQQVRNPYETARSRMHLAVVLDELGHSESAKLELLAARRVFEDLGATPDAREAARRLGDDSPTYAVCAFMFTDIVNSTSLLSAIGDEAWNSLRGWHDRTVATIVAEHQGRIVKGTGDGFFVAFDEPTLAVDSAIAIQRALEEHRRRDAFSPPVRIGIHVGSAITAGNDYSGQDVVVAARISALAGAGEILVSAAVESLMGPHVTIAGHRSTELKGIPSPVEVALVDWR